MHARSASFKSCESSNLVGSLLSLVLPSHPQSFLLWLAHSHGGDFWIFCLDLLSFTTSPCLILKSGLLFALVMSPLLLPLPPFLDEKSIAFLTLTPASSLDPPSQHCCLNLQAHCPWLLCFHTYHVTSAPLSTPLNATSSVELEIS